MSYDNGVVFHVLGLLEFGHEMYAYSQNNDASYPLQRKSSEEKNTECREGKGWDFGRGHCEAEGRKQAERNKRQKWDMASLVAKEIGGRPSRSYAECIIAD